MRVSDYFKQQQSQHISNQIKQDIFCRIQKEKLCCNYKSETLSSKRFIFATKKVVYSSFAVFLFVLVFGGALLERKEIIDFGFFSILSQNSYNTVSADYVAEIVDFNGEYSLLRNGVVISDSTKLNIIENGDVIQLTEGTQLVFTLTDGTQARIDGPAEFSISKNNKGYQISLIYGKFFRIYCPECKSDIDISTSDLMIHQDKNQSLDVQMAKEEGELIVKNNSDKITISQRGNDTNNEVKLSQSETVSITSNSGELDVISGSDLMALFLAKNNISGSFTISNEEVQLQDVDSATSKKIVAMNVQNKDSEEIQIDTYNSSQSSQDVENLEEDPILNGIIEVMSSDFDDGTGIDEKVQIELGLSADTLQLPSADQMQTLKTNLNSFFLMNIFESIYINDNAGQNIAQLAQRINDISKSFNYELRANNSLISIKNTVNQLKDSLSQDWYITPSYILQLEKISNRCKRLGDMPEDVEYSIDDWTKFKSDLPINLRLM